MDYVMSKVGFIGLGKLGLPVALAIESKGHQVSGYDIDEQVSTSIRQRYWPFQEEIVPELIAKTKLQIKELDDLIEWSDLLFIAIQTPHDSKYEGITRLPQDRKDFEYNYLVSGIKEIATICKKLKKQKTIVVISTCLPGTFKTKIEPHLNQYVDYVYSPQFIGMGTVIPDYLNPEFVLCGTKDGKRHKKLEEFYFSLYGEDKTFWTDITTAEGIKVFYNTILTTKMSLGNAMGEMSHKMGMNADHVHEALSKSNKRIISPAYLRSGVGGGGGCQPRDNIALSWLADEIGMSHNIWEDNMLAREHHAEWLANMAKDLSVEHKLPLVILGRTFKPESNIETGSSSHLMAHILKEDYDFQFSHVEDWNELIPAVYLISTQHKRYQTYDFPPGSVVIDPFRYITASEGVKLIRIGG